MENTQTNDIYIRVLLCDGCESHGNNWRQMGSDECDHLGECPAAGGAATDLIRQTKAGS